MRPLVAYFFGLFLLSCSDEIQNSESSTIQKRSHHVPTLSNILQTYDRYKGFEIINSGPRGNTYTNSLGQPLFYRVFRIQLINDTIYSVEINLGFKGKPIALRPDTSQFVKVFLFPDKLTPDTIKDIYNFGIRGLEAFLETDLKKPTTYKKLIHPGEECILYIGVIINDGLARSQLFINGEVPNIPFPQDPAFVEDKRSENTLDIIFGVQISPPKNSSLIHCGQIIFKKP